MNLIIAVAVLSVALGAGTVAAQSEPVADRQAIMKQMGGATGQLSRMSKGEVPFDLAAAQAALQIYVEGGQTFPALFPDGAQGTGKATAAAWDRKADLQAASAALTDAAQKAQASVKDLDSLKAAMPDIGRQCGACHQTFRQPS